ncbi:TPA: 5-oxoprolinase/urea amidolyase family protein [Vibrio vulnificus]|uniref:5-oxoprolinase subunit C family protein n=1 Tax=Vibrio sp. 05-20-BW147 TaxID=2575834 RepID=UPI0015943BA8|nr:biotin-dependent carboxyltransferase family protein [Vibrio sp. 05-20-BW147]NVC64243.1 biotin-dependent carboxyltransferase [Vibrio sp. 05-20-BW147]HAS6347044.1 5-oxoprolinase/urea amidolyase family protein [Vibrio vulnificus]
MSQGSLRVIKAGPLSLVQDFGRFGLAHVGITQGGPVDDYAYSWSNYLLENPVNLTSIEITLGQTVFEVLADCHLSICGGDLTACLNGASLNNWSDFVAKQGDILSFGLPRNGLRAYLSVKGGFDVPLHLGSSSAVSRDHLGGLSQDGSVLQANDMLFFTSHPLPKSKPRALTFRFKPDYNLPLKLRVIEGFQAQDFDPNERERLYQTRFEVDTNSNRMGYRLNQGKIIPPYSGILSEGITLGAIQVPPSGHPIVLLNDRQTIGGYPKIGCVARIDIPRLAQAKPGQEVRFVKGDREGLQDVWCQWARFFGY